jgi:glycosyltransferase involved in cell wall biosynthesis
LETIVKYFPTNFTVELIVVNNNSNDSTAQTLTDFANKHSWCSVVNEPKQGLSQARNAGFQSSSYSWILFLDDDAKIDRNLFNRVQEHIKSQTYQCIGGLYLPWYMNEKPKWFRDNLVSNRLAYDKLQPMQTYEFASGGVFLINKNLLEKHKGFCTSYGMHGTHLGYGEETDLQRRIRKSGHKVAYDPKMIIYHHIPPHKMTVSWHLNSSFQKGKTFLKTAGYPHNIFSGILAFIIGAIQLFVFIIVCFPKLFLTDYFIQNYTIDVLRKPLKWFGAFRATLSFRKRPAS